VHIVHVKHYLTADGIHFLKSNWFPKVLFILTQQMGFISLNNETKISSDDCVYLILRFQNKALMDKWDANPNHNGLINELDIYRSRDYWEYATTHLEESPLLLQWQKVEM
jgi:hypothetical protein